MRTLKLTSPLTKGEDVRALQKAINTRLTRHQGWGVPVTVDGEYGKETAAAERQVAFYLGTGRKSLNVGATPGQQRIVMHPNLRTPGDLARARQRRHHDDTAGVIAWERSQLGTHEQGTSNRGTMVDRFEREFGILGAAWCGAFQGYALRKIGGVPVTDRVVYCPYIEEDAKHGVNGFASWHPWTDRHNGDLVLFDFGEGIAQHVGMYVGNGMTIEGNTSAPGGSSEDDGGTVAEKQRDPANIIGCARPRW